MNKETKVGLLVGLSFIVLFGVILSNQAPDIVAPAEKPMATPARTAQHSNTQVVRQIENTPPPPEPVDVVADLTEPSGPTAAQPPAGNPMADAADSKPEAKPAPATAEPTTLSAAAPADAAKTITAENLGPETADAEPGDDGMQMVSSKVDADGTKTTVYIVKSGDSLAKIARQHYGDATNRSIDKIYEANKDKMPNKRTLAVGMKLHVPAKPAPKDKTTDELLDSGKFDAVAEMKPARGEAESPKAKDATAVKSAKDPKDAPADNDALAARDAKQTKEVDKASPKDSKKASARTAVTEVSQETLESILRERTAPPQADKTTSKSTAVTTDLVEAVETVSETSVSKADTAADKALDKTLDKALEKALGKDLDSGALASRENCKRYQIQKGDTWYKLAAKFMGDAKRWHDLYALNDDILPDATKLRTGVKIRVPAGGTKGHLDYAVE
jgi:nucleoid-associated protein YgaU